MTNKLAKAFMQLFKDNFNVEFISDFKSVFDAYIKKDYLYDVFKDCKEAQWDKTLKLFAECGEGYFIFNEPKIDIICQGEGWYYLDIETIDFFIRIENEKEFYYYQKNIYSEFTKKINKKHIKEMFQYFANFYLDI
jgi:hypothetical protein